MARNTTAPADQDPVEQDTTPKPPARVKLRNTFATNGEIGAIATPLKKDAAVWRANGWVDAD